MLTVHTPERSLEQRMSALKNANRIRSHRAALKRKVKTGMVDVPALIENPDELIESMKLYDLLMAMPKLGRVKVQKILARCHISPSKTLGGLSDRQRREIVIQLTTREGGSHGARRVTASKSPTF